jgi:hypothetical protein
MHYIPRLFLLTDFLAYDVLFLLLISFNGRAKLRLSLGRRANLAHAEFRPGRSR